jgi:DMSO/TMAO reductase YedYZ molybdopterin-dependent catalytic subunit
MERWKSLGVGLLIIILIAGAGFFFWRRGDSPKTSLEKADGETVEVTPTDEMRVRTAEGQPDINLADYRLTVEGFVANKLTLGFDEILSLDADERLVDLPCVEGWTETGLWKGVRLETVLDRAGVLEGADNVVFSSPDGYTTSLTLEDIWETDPILAYEVNGESLPVDQGFPLRLVVPDRLGYKWIKWVTTIELIAGQYKGFWESRGYSNEAEASGR